MACKPCTGKGSEVEVRKTIYWGRDYSQKAKILLVLLGASCGGFGSNRSCDQYRLANHAASLAGFCVVRHQLALVEI
jgi:hypothetical protein